MSNEPNLAVEIAGIKFQNPVLVASGTFGCGQEYASFIDLSRLGAIVVKSITLQPYPGNPPPRIAETASGMLNAVGLQNPGVNYFLADCLPYLRQSGVPVIVSIAGSTVEEYAALAGRLNEAEEVTALEVNISCPNVKHGGLQFGASAVAAAEVVKAVRAATAKPVIVKLSPNVTSIVEIAQAAADAGADALSMINTILGMVIDIHRRRPVLGNVTGGLSGPAIRPVAIRAVWEVYKAVSLPIIGMGGVVNARDALAFMMAGARAVAVGTANFLNPRATIEVLEGMATFLRENGVKDINELVGAAHSN